MSKSRLESFRDSLHKQREQLETINLVTKEIAMPERMTTPVRIKGFCLINGIIFSFKHVLEIS